MRERKGVRERQERERDESVEKEGRSWVPLGTDGASEGPGYERGNSGKERERSRERERNGQRVGEREIVRV